MRIVTRTCATQYPTDVHEIPQRSRRGRLRVPDHLPSYMIATGRSCSFPAAMTSEKVEMAVHSYGANVTHPGNAAQMIHRDRGVAQPFVRQALQSR